MPIDKVRMIISSRCKDYPQKDGGNFELKALRKALKEHIDSEVFFGQVLLQCFTNEHERPLVVSCGTQQSELQLVVEPCGHVGRLPLSLSTCPQGGVGG